MLREQPRTGSAPALLIGAALATAAALIGLFVPLAVPLLIGLALAAAAAWLLAVRPWLAWGLYLFLLPPHVLLMAILLVHVGLPGGAVKALSAWKEALLALLLLGVLFRLRLTARVRVALPDLLIGLYTVLLGLLMLLALATTSSLTAWAYGARDALLPIALYAVGRSLPLREPVARRAFYLIVGAALLFSAAGVFERLLVPTELFVTLGLPRYFRELLGTYYPDYLMGLPENFWTSSNSGLMRRAVSVYGSSQPFALSYLLLLPFCIYGLIDRTIPRRWLIWAAFLASLAGLLLTITRFTILICVVVMLLAAMLSSARARRLIAAGVVGLAVVGVAILIAVPSVRLLVVNTITFQDHSSSSRLQIWGESLGYVAENPFGVGLGAAGQTGGRFGTSVVAVEGQYAKVVVEQGVLGLLIYIGVLIALSMYLLRAAFRSREKFTRGICFALSLAFIGLSINSMTTEWQNSIALLYPTYWLAGSAVAYAVTLSAPQAEARPAPRPVGEA